MCGIVGLFLKDETLRPDLGALLSDMLITMTDRGPDSAGVAIYGVDEGSRANLAKLTIGSDAPEDDFPELAPALSAAIDGSVSIRMNDTHAILELPADRLDAARTALLTLRPGIHLMSRGERLEIYKAVGEPRSVVERFGLRKMAGTHGIGHTRMATESAVTTNGAHPFCTAPDQCLVHNGSLSNHNALRRRLARAGITVETENDSEVAAAYLTWRMREGADLGSALRMALDDLDGFFTFVVGTADGFGVLRDPIACKPAVMAETDRYVAFGSEYRALVGLPGIETARVWEPEPATVYFWTQAGDVAERLAA